MPAISKFEDKLKENNDHNERIDHMMRRVDEILLLKSDKEYVKEFRTLVEVKYITKDENLESKQKTDESIKGFEKKIGEIDEMVKF